MNTQEIRFTLVHVIAKYDEKQSKKPGYNPYAAGIALQMLEQIMADIEAGADIRQAIVAGFQGRLLDACLRALNLPLTTEQEARSGQWFYKPVSSK